MGESFADIFFGNCVALGMPCVTASAADIEALMAAVEQDPTHDLLVDMEALTVMYRGKVYAVTVPPGARTQWLDGTWDATRIPLQAQDQTRRTAARLPYVGGFRR